MRPLESCHPPAQRQSKKWLSAGAAWGKQRETLDPTEHPQGLRERRGATEESVSKAMSVKTPFICRKLTSVLPHYGGVKLDNLYRTRNNWMLWRGCAWGQRGAGDTGEKVLGRGQRLRRRGFNSGTAC